MICCFRMKWTMGTGKIKNVKRWRSRLRYSILFKVLYWNILKYWIYCRRLFIFIQFISLSISLPLQITRLERGKDLIFPYNLRINLKCFLISTLFQFFPFCIWLSFGSFLSEVLWCFSFDFHSFGWIIQAHLRYSKPFLLPQP